MLVAGRVTGTGPGGRTSSLLRGWAGCACGGFSCRGAGSRGWPRPRLGLPLSRSTALGGMRSLGERMQRRNWKEVGWPTQGSRVPRVSGLESSPERSGGRGWDLVTQRGRGQKPPSPGLIDAGAGGKGAARSSGARQGGEEEMDGQRQESRGRERRALGGELCACSAPEGAPRARGDESRQGSWEQPRLSGWRAVSGSWRGAGLGARRPGRSSSAARSPLSPPPRPPDSSRRLTRLCLAARGPATLTPPCSQSPGRQPRISWLLWP